MYGKAQLREDFIGFINVLSDVTADSLSSAVLSVIPSTGTDVGFYHGQGYDGVSAMSDHLNGVRAIIRKSYPLAWYTYCADHCLNLALSKACTVPIITNSLGAITELMIFQSLCTAQSLARGYNWCYVSRNYNCYAKTKATCPPLWN